MATFDLKAFFRLNIESARDDYLKDLAALSAESLTKKPGGVARSALDYTYEVVVVNQRLAMRLRGETPPKWPFENGAFAPVDWTKEQAEMEFTDSMNVIVSTMNALSEDEINRQEGDNTPCSMLHMASLHAMYHDGQLNYLQALEGDAEVHW